MTGRDPDAPRPDYFDGQRLTASDLDSEQPHRRPLRFLALAGAVVITALTALAARASWPKKYTGPEFKAKSNEVAIETLELGQEGLEVDGGADDEP
jgi:phage tail-like protein